MTNVDDMYQKSYWEIQAVLDKALGSEEEDGAGATIVADVMLLAHRYELALEVLGRVRNLGTVVQEIKSAPLPDPIEGMAS